MHFSLLQKVFISGAASLMLWVLLATGVNSSYKTVDDRDKLYKLLEDNKPLSVLGANSETKSEYRYCPEAKPVVGWIDFQGRKTIRTELPENQEASSCFVTTQEANEAGFNYIK